MSRPVGRNCRNQHDAHEMAQPNPISQQALSQSLTQESFTFTPRILDPRRLGRNNSGLSDADISDVICILHPTSLAAFHLVEDMAETRPQHVLFADSDLIEDYQPTPLLEEGETIILDHSAQRVGRAKDLALRFSSRTSSPSFGFVFGRNPTLCDILFQRDSAKKFSNTHFRIYLKDDSDYVMIQDLSTNGTIVDNNHLKGKDPSGRGGTRMLQQGSEIAILASDPNQVVRFVVRFPSRAGHEAQYTNKLQMYKAIARRDEETMHPALRELLEGVARIPAESPRKHVAYKPTFHHNSFGMHWSGGEKYNVVGVLGKGAFATVYRIATKLDGQDYAAKELEMTRFVKDGKLDKRLDNEIQIMKNLTHPNIIQYHEFFDRGSHLYIIMEFVPFGDLQGLLSKNGPLPEHMAKQVAYQILHALAYLHHKNITHRDIKPDNILISSFDPFTVKLSDFGLSKHVSHQETFLKTFCGTLLYCAPEVFPHYETHVTSNNKRRRPGDPSPKQMSHKYSSAVDIWSFAAVLWFALCQKPPFEGVMDATGYGMFNKIMSTPLDTAPLRDAKVSLVAIDLLKRMLHTDPLQRPSEAECLQHPWFAEFGPSNEEYLSSPKIEYPALNAIPEEEEVQEGISQLSFYKNMQDAHAGGDEDDLGYDSADYEFLDPRQSKRLKSMHAENHATNGYGIGPSVALQRFISADDSMVIPAQVARPRLFGEIGKSALESSGVLDARTHFALQMEGGQNDESSGLSSGNRANLKNVMTLPDQQPGVRVHAVPALPKDAPLLPTPDITQVVPSKSAGSLLGAESRFRGLNMDHSGSAAGSRSNPRTQSATSYPQSSAAPAMARGDTTEEPPQHSHDETPKQPAFVRRINLPVLPSYYWDARDPKTHTLEYASKVSGIDFTQLPFAGLLDSNAETTSIPPTAGSSVVQAEDDVESPVLSLPLQEETSSQFLRPRTRLGRLSTTPDSYTSISLKIEDMVTSWGRQQDCTHVYNDAQDTRIPKRAFFLAFHHSNLQKAREEQRDWTKLKNLQVVITTLASKGIWVNDVHLRRKQNGRTCYGYVRTGDVITIYQPHKNPATGGFETLSFTCEFYYGEAARGRADGEKFQILLEEKKPKAPTP